MGTAATVKSSRPRPQPISGTPPPDALQNGLFLGAVAAKVRSSAGGGGIEEPVKIRQGLPLPGEDQLIRGGGDQLTSGGRNDQFVNGGDRCDLKTIQKTCSLFGLDLERPPPVPPSRPYTVRGNSKISYPQSRQMKKTFQEGGFADGLLQKGEHVVVIGASTRRGHLVVEKNNSTLHVPFQFLELNSQG